MAAGQALSPDSEGTTGHLALAANIEEEDAACRAAIPPLAALKQLDTRIANLTRREAKLSAAAARQRAELDTLEADLAAVHAELGTATPERSAAAARVAIPFGLDNVDLETVARSTIQTLVRVSEIGGKSATPALMREHIQQSVVLIRALADEAAAAAAAAPDAHARASPADLPIELIDDQDMELEQATEEDLRLAE